MEYSFVKVVMGNGKTKPILGVEYYGENLNSWHRIFMIGRWQMDTLIVYVQFTSYIVVSLSSKFKKDLHSEKAHFFV